MVTALTFGERLVEAREQLGLNQRQLAEILEITPTRLNYWEKDKRQPDVPMIKALARALQVSADYLIGNDPITNIKKAPSLSDEAMKLAKDYDINLDDWGQKAVRGLADTEIARCEAERLRQLTQQDAEFAADLAPRTKIIPLRGNSFAVGRGDPDFGNPWEDYEVPIDTVADFAVRISGDSMEPYLPDGSIQLCRKGDPSDGEVAALLVDGTFICKQVCKDMYGNLNLFSLNRARADADQTILRDSGRSVSCFGTVIMHERIPLPDCLGR